MAKKAPVKKAAAKKSKPAAKAARSKSPARASRARAAAVKYDQPGAPWWKKVLPAG
jgi:hypothetical protein